MIPITRLYRGSRSFPVSPFITHLMSSEPPSKPSAQSRRTFLRAATASLGATAVAGCLPSQTAAGHARVSPLISPSTGGVILFQGDSITDVGRDRTVADANHAKALGNGYPAMIAGALLSTGAPWRIYNRGIAGHKVPQLQARWDRDTLALKPDILSILIGVNDYWHTKSLNYTGTAADYETGLTGLVTETRKAFPQVHVVLLEPFVAQFGAVDASWFPAFDERRAVAARVATATGSTYVPLQAVFDRLGHQTTPQEWFQDGVHPTVLGHAAIAEQWRLATGL
jgi:lysophospholipase L1-like esterase